MSTSGPASLPCDVCAEGSSQGLDSALPDEHYSDEQGQEARSAGSSGSLGTSGRSETWGPGGELVSISDLQFSRLIGEVGCCLWCTPRFHTLPRCACTAETI